jgi:hypothetical protein
MMIKYDSSKEEITKAELCFSLVAITAVAADDGTPCFFLLCIKLRFVYCPSLFQEDYHHFAA